MVPWSPLRLMIWLRQCRQLERPLAALAGPQIHFEMECLSCCGGVRLSHEDLTRLLVNLTRNAAEAMPQGDGGSFLILRFRRVLCFSACRIRGLGFRDLIGRIFDAGFTTKKRNGANRGLGLSIVRRLTEAAGGNVRATAAPGGGTRFEVELPLIHCARANSGFPADFPERAN